MDKQIKRNNKSTKKIILWVLPAIILISFLIMNLTRKKQVNVKKENISIREVSRGDFEDVILFNSTVTPKTTVLVNVIQGGSVSEIFVESGQIVKKGTPLLKVYNPNAELNYLTQETAIVEQINNLRNIRVNITNQQLNLDQQLLSIGNDYRNATRQFKLDSTLYSKDVVAKNDYQKSTQEYSYQKERSGVIKKSVFEEKKSRSVQLTRINISIKNMQKSLELLRKNKENFTVKAPVNGLLSSFNPILGENYNQGQPIGKIDVLDGYKLEAKVDEYYISKVSEGIKGSISLNGIDYETKIDKIFTEIVNGQFKVELVFTEKTAPKNVKRGMSLKSKVFLSGKSEALLVPKGLFYQSTNGKYVFVLDTENKAVKRTIKIGRENPFYYEVLDGLKAGDKIIVSSYDDYKKVEEINIE
ncbi:efflux RND transporter periplasmic adaptor subunit [Tenacibaculum insulae]|uniref:efflux RND transporter periplasmic adaptor subunit n=1 Tax=Tenacibaculum insulae TaxID=2029677 RepID=UPI003AB2B4B1